jgi:hypothetical protein
VARVRLGRERLRRVDLDEMLARQGTPQPARRSK